MASNDPTQEFEDDDVDYEEMALPEEELQKLTIAWQNELCAPCLLPTQADTLDNLIDQIEGMEENISKQTDKTQLRISLHRMELQRISFLTSDYVRCRLHKIEANPNDAIEMHRKRVGDGKTPLLSDSELKFAEEYAKAEAELFDKTVLESMPAALRKMPVPLPDHQDDMVYAKVVGDDVGNVAVPDWKDLTGELILDMEKSSCHLIPFESVKELVEEGAVRLL